MKKKDNDKIKKSVQTSSACDPIRARRNQDIEIISVNNRNYYTFRHSLNFDSITITRLCNMRRFLTAAKGTIFS